MAKRTINEWEHICTVIDRFEDAKMQMKQLMDSYSQDFFNTTNEIKEELIQIINNRFPHIESEKERIRMFTELCQHSSQVKVWLKFLDDVNPSRVNYDMEVGVFKIMQFNPEEDCYCQVGFWNIADVRTRSFIKQMRTDIIPIAFR